MTDGQGPAVDAPESERSSAARRRVLVVDDEQGVRESLRLLLRDRYDVALAEDGEEALRRVASEPFDAVLLDVIMPGIDGLTVLERIKGQRPELPVVIVTTRGSEADKRRGLEAGADGYVTKGDLVRQDLVDVVSRLLA